jgi:O-methyltransferase involved in polyketide biosynthesis
VPYLTQDAIGGTLDYIASIPNAEVAFDYIQPAEAFSDEFRAILAGRTEQLEKIGERWRSVFEPTEIAAILRSHGFSEIEDVGFPEYASKFGSAIQGLAPGRVGVNVVHARRLTARSSAASPPA